jgi:hypothetical protein
MLASLKPGCQHWLSCPRSVSDGDVAVPKKEIAWTQDLSTFLDVYIDTSVQSLCYQTVLFVVRPAEIIHMEIVFIY